MRGVEHVRRPISIVGAALLVVVGLLLAFGSPGGPLQSNKAHAYGGATPQPPTNPKSQSDCDAYYGKGGGRKSPEARECKAKVARKVGYRKCAKKTGTARAKCRKAVQRAYKKAQAAIKKQRAAEKACGDARAAGINALDPNDPAYTDKAKVIDDEYSACLAKARA